jgi:signal transduction histidine kinase
MLPLGVLLGPRLLKAHAQVASALLAPAREAMAAQVGQLAESRSQAVDASAAELRRIERDLRDGAQARLVSLGMNIGFAEQVLRDNPDLALSLLAEARTSSVRPGGVGALLRDRRGPRQCDQAQRREPGLGPA